MDIVGRRWWLLVEWWWRGDDGVGQEVGDDLFLVFGGQLFRPATPAFLVEMDE